APLIFVLWSAVALGMLFWGRGVFCGWLCPFGALQELTNQAAQRLGVRQIAVPQALHERLWVIKYSLFVGLVALSFYSMEQALILAEVEPFKTAISMRFMRAWPFVVYVLVLLGAGRFIERFFCRYLCPLGGGWRCRPSSRSSTGSSGARNAAANAGCARRNAPSAPSTRWAASTPMNVCCACAVRSS